jgi:hypothetical protein
LALKKQELTNAGYDISFDDIFLNETIFAKRLTFAIKNFAVNDLLGKPILVISDRLVY